MRVFITGGTGFVGASVVRLLVQRGDSVLVATRRPLKNTRIADLCMQVETLDCDLATGALDRATLQKFAPEALLHLGWIGVGGGERNDVAQLRNISAVGVIAEAVAEAGAEALIGFGSQAEYGPCRGRTDESRPARPTTLYGIAKVAAGQTMLQIAARKNLRGVWGRIYSVYGPGADPGTLLPSLLASLANGRVPELTRCEQIWELLHVEDCARAAVALLDAPRASGLFNIGTGEPIKLRDVVLMLRDKIAPTIEPRFGAIPYRTDQVMHLEADFGRIRRITGWRPEILLADGFASLVSSVCARAARRRLETGISATLQRE